MVRLPQNYTQWNSENEGPSTLSLLYYPTQETETILYDTDTANEFSWYIVSEATTTSKGEINETIEVDQIKV